MTYISNIFVLLDLFWEHWDELFAMEFPCIVVTSRLGYNVLVKLCDWMSFQYVGPSIKHLYIARVNWSIFCISFQNKLACVFYRMEGSFFSLSCKDILIVSVDVYCQFCISVCFIIIPIFQIAFGWLWYFVLLLPIDMTPIFKN